MKTYKFKINGKDYTVDINGIEGKNADVTVNGVAYSVELDNEVAAPAPAVQAAPVSPAAPAAAPAAPAAAPAAPAGAGVAVKSPLPGVIISIDVKEGQAVKKGQKVAVLEAMKMENEIQSDADGTVTAVLVSKGDSVLEGAELIKIA
jgi:biotin carboxyl carrier protein